MKIEDHQEELLAKLTGLADTLNGDKSSEEQFEFKDGSDDSPKKVVDLESVPNPGPPVNT